MKHLARSGLLLVFLLLALPARAQDAEGKVAAPAAIAPPVSAPAKAWYEKFSLKGYAQLRYNRLLETNADLKCDQCDKSWGNNGSLFIRRARLILSGEVSDRLFVYIQPDLASDASTGSQHFLQLRDLYFDVALDSSKEFRIRAGLSKVPYGWENLQSSSNRLALDRTDGINSAVPNERDLGVFFYWAPSEIRKRFKYLVDSGLKGTGDYGVVGVGAYNGQSANRTENNNNRHLVARVSYPFLVGSEQFIEPGLQAYSGRFTLLDKTPGVGGGDTFDDRRVAASFIVYPQPIGFQAEYNVGKGPSYNPATNTVDTDDLHGGYVQAMYMLKMNTMTLTPFTRYHIYQGGKKQELDARSYDVRDLEIGVEWQATPNIELTADYTISRRRFEDGKKKSNFQEGNLLRLQAQFNY